MDEPRTEAGRRLLASLRDHAWMYRGGKQLCEVEAKAILAIEAEAIALAEKDAEPLEDHKPRLG